MDTLSIQYTAWIQRRKSKEGIDKFGDLIIWKELLIFARENKQNIIFITLDNKEDWWDSDKSSARKELIQEFRRYNNENEIAFLSLSDFYSLATI